MVRIGAFQRASLIFARALTSVHVGIGRAGGIVDLPVERDSLGFPTIPASGLKGAIRERFRGCDHEECIFGSRPERRAPYAGAFSVLDAYLVAMPARSLKGVWVLVTAPLALRRLQAYTQLAGVEDVKLNGIIEELSGLTHNEVAVTSEGKDKLAFNGKVLLNEEFELKAEVHDELKNLARFFDGIEEWRIAGVHDDIFKPMVERSLLRRARIRLIPEKKTVKAGGLWTEEDVPANALFATVFLYAGCRAPNEVKRLGAHEVKEHVENNLLTKGKGYLLLGGHETVGRGLVKLTPYRQ